MSELKLIKIVTPEIETVFLGKEPLNESRLRTPTEVGHIIPLDRVLRRAGGFTPRLQALRVLGYQNAGEFPNGLLVATTRDQEVRRVFRDHVAHPQDEMCGEVIASTLDQGDPNLTYLRIERIRLEVFRLSLDQLEELRRCV